LDQKEVHGPELRVADRVNALGQQEVWGALECKREGGAYGSGVTGAQRTRLREFERNLSGLGSNNEILIKTRHEVRAFEFIEFNHGGVMYMRDQGVKEEN